MTVKSYKKVVMIHLKPTCDKRRTKKDGTHPIVFRISLGGKSRDLTSGLSCLLSHWDNYNNCVRPKTLDLQVLSQRIKDKELMLIDKLRKYEQSFPDVTDVQLVKNFLCAKKEEPRTVGELWIEEISRMEKARRYGNANNYRSALRCN
jgi:integrase/recombinase XerD